MSSSSRSSSRSGAEESHFGLLSEKHDLFEDQKTKPVTLRLKPRPFGSFRISFPCLLFRHLSRFLSQLLNLLLPSFLQRGPPNGQGNLDTLAPTAFLDGMRGLAAFVVFICHLTYGTFDIGHAWGAHPDQPTLAHKNFLRLPIVRLLYSGPPMVAIFFVISGYA